MYVPHLAFKSVFVAAWHRAHIANRQIRQKRSMSAAISAHGLTIFLRSTAHRGIPEAGLFSLRCARHDAMYDIRFIFWTDLKFGVAYVPLEPLLNKCETHVVVPLVNPESERKAVGGKLDVRVASFW